MERVRQMRRSAPAAPSPRGGRDEEPAVSERDDRNEDTQSTNPLDSMSQVFGGHSGEGLPEQLPDEDDMGDSHMFSDGDVTPGRRRDPLVDDLGGPMPPHGEEL